MADENEERGQETRVGNEVVAGDDATVARDVVPEAEESAPAAEGKTEIFFSREDAAAQEKTSDTDETEAVGAFATGSASGQVSGGGEGDQAAATHEAVAAGTAETAWNQGTSPAAADREAADSKGTLDEHPELLAAGAFVGGLVVAMVLRKLGGDDG